ncbi:MAG: hypothetical protein WAZ94_13320 [Phycisphaerales bacterium]
MANITKSIHDPEHPANTVMRAIRKVRDSAEDLRDLHEASLIGVDHPSARCGAIRSLTEAIEMLAPREGAEEHGRTGRSS